MGIFGNIPGLVLWISFFTSRLFEWEGFFQRLGIVFPLLWMEVMATQLLLLSVRDKIVFVNKRAA
jgi:hypothetical protein